ncbi:hypothetical protein R3P38DRAFT_2759240 [Favolaschia claudopus]|uniref:Uncharacterized protein n=1 Tax=Favolaschia claudopus TaxID=2862362 RepID=A0AAW0E5G6_9AGAR
MSAVGPSNQSDTLRRWLQAHPIAAQAAALDLFAARGIAAARTALLQLLRDHPKALRAAGIALLGAGLAVIVPALLVAVLNLIGFGAGGVAAGSLAAIIHASIGNVAAGSAFAWAQAAAAGGIAVAPVALQLLGAGAVAVGAWLGFRRRPKNRDVIPSGRDDNTEDDDDENAPLLIEN